MNQNKKFKVVLMGASSAGKTSIVVRFARGTFGADQESTIGAAFISRDIQTDKGLITLHIWDTAGQERYHSLVPKYSQGSKAIIIVFDVSDPESYKVAQSWVSEAKELHENRVEYFLVANKIDLEHRVSLDKAVEYAKGNELNFFTTSAKTGEGISTLFTAIAESVINLIPALEQDPDDILSSSPKEKSSSCC